MKKILKLLASMFTICFIVMNSVNAVNTQRDYTSNVLTFNTAKYYFVSTATLSVSNGRKNLVNHTETFYHTDTHGFLESYSYEHMPIQLLTYTDRYEVKTSGTIKYYVSAVVYTSGPNLMMTTIPRS